MGPYASGVTVNAAHAWAAPGTYYMRVKAKDTAGFETSWSPILIVTVVEAKPNLAVTSITGGLLRASAAIQNTGLAAAANIQWTINLTGGILLSGRTRAGSLVNLDVDAKESFTDFPVIGFGSVTITVTVRAEGVPDLTDNASGFVFLCYTLV
jgi:hypothetical protein